MEHRQQICTNSTVPQLIKAGNVDPKKSILLSYSIYSYWELEASISTSTGASETCTKVTDMVHFSISHV